MPLMPRVGTLERLLLDAMIESNKFGNGVTFMDFEGTGITEGNINQIAQNLRNGMYESEDDVNLEKDA